MGNDEIVHTDSYIFESIHTDSDADLQLRLPIEYFKKFLDDDILNLIVDQLYLYSIQKDTNKPLSLDLYELEQWVGICFHFSIFKISDTKLHWSTCMSQTKITS